MVAPPRPFYKESTMNAQEIIEKIRAEVNRRKLLLTQHSKLTYDLIRETFIKEYDDLLRFLSDLEKECEKPTTAEGLEEEISRYLREDCSKGQPSIREVVRHFAKWGAEHIKK